MTKDERPEPAETPWPDDKVRQFTPRPRDEKRSGKEIAGSSTGAAPGDDDHDPGPAAA